MGMESYYFSISMQTILSGENIFCLFCRHCIVRPYNTVRCKKREATVQERFSIDHKFVVEIFEKNDRVEISFEGCFTNYYNNLTYIYEILSIFMRFGTIELLVDGKAFEMNDMCFADFVQLIQRSHQHKFELFHQKYGSNSFKDLLPNEFYKTISPFMRKKH